MSAVASYGDETAAIMGYLKAQWDEGLVPVAWPNTELDFGGQLHIEPKVVRQEAFNATVSRDSKRVRHPGLLTFEIRQGIGKGDGEAVDVGDDLCDLFRNLSLDGIRFRAPTLRDFGRDGDSYHVQVTVPFYRDTIFND